MAVRGRPVGSGTPVRETCPTHPGSRVRLNGMYGAEGRRRQMYRCLPEGGKAHNFAGAAPRLVAASSTCGSCENPVASHEGPRVARTYDFPVAQAVAALVMVGQGVSYTEAADRTRVRNQRGRLESGAQLVVNWVEVLGPVVAAQRSETTWPETVVLDSTWFEVRNTWDGTKSRAFNVLGVYGYEDDGPGRTWALHASPQARQADWMRLLRGVAGEPRLVVCDDDQTIQRAVQKVWPTAEVKLCEHHLRVGVMRQMKKYGLTKFGSPEMELLNDAFHSAGERDRFRRAVKGIEVEAWIEAHDTQVRQQAKRRRHLPDHHSTGALDEVLAKVREFMAPRAFCYRNAERTNRMLELVRLRLNRADDPDAYGAAIRAHLDANWDLPSTTDGQDRFDELVALQQTLATRGAFPDPQQHVAYGDWDVWVVKSLQGPCPRYRLRRVVRRRNDPALRPALWCCDRCWKDSVRVEVDDAYRAEVADAHRLSAYMAASAERSRIRELLEGLDVAPEVLAAIDDLPL